MLNAQGDFALVLKVVGAIVVVEEPTFVAENVEGNAAVDVVLVEDAIDDDAVELAAVVGLVITVSVAVEVVVELWVMLVDVSVIVDTGVVELVNTVQFWPENPGQQLSVKESLGFI